MFAIFKKKKSSTILEVKVFTIFGKKRERERKRNDAGCYSASDGVINTPHIKYVPYILKCTIKMYVFISISML